VDRHRVDADRDLHSHRNVRLTISEGNVANRTRPCTRAADRVCARWKVTWRRPGDGGRSADQSSRLSGSCHCICLAFLFAAIHRLLQSTHSYRPQSYPALGGDCRSRV
jgi:hypothetical protein